MGKDGKPRGKMTAYAFFVQTCREEHKKKYPGEQIVFAEFSKKCAGKWKVMDSKDKIRFDEMAEKDKVRFEHDMLGYKPPPGQRAVKRKRVKDPNAPKRALSAFFFFCNEVRSHVKEQHPSYTIGETAKELGRRWETCQEKPRFEQLSTKDKQRYEQAMKAYREGGTTSFKRTASEKTTKPTHEDEDDDDEDEEEDEDEGNTNYL